MKSFLERWVGKLFREVAMPSGMGRAFPTYGDALAMCNSRGYESDEIIDVVVEKTRLRSREMRLSRKITMEDARIAVGLCSLRPASSLRVLDFGGGAGHLYFVARQLLGESIDLRWHVVETAKMVSVASKLSEPGLSFYESIEGAVRSLGRVDLVLSNSSLPYTSDPLSYLGQLLEIGANHVFITRTALSDSEDTFSLVQKSRLAHNGPGPLPEGFRDFEVEYPLTIVGEKTFDSLIRRKYDVRFRIDEGEQAHSGLHHRVQLHSFFCDRGGER